jgi:hypothetical protein
MTMTHRIRKVAVLSACSLVAFAACVFAQTEIEAKHAKLEAFAGRLEQLVEQKSAHVDKLTIDLLAKDEEIEEQVSEIVTYLSSVKDTPETGTKVVRAKKAAIDGLKDAAMRYGRRRGELKGQLARYGSAAAKEDAARGVAVLNDRVERRVDEIIQLTTSLTGDEYFQKYAYGADAGGWQRKESDEYRQVKKERQQARPVKRSVEGELEKSIQRLDMQAQSTKAGLGYKRGEDRAIAESQIEYDQQLAEKRKEQLAAVQAGGTTPLRGIGKDEASQLEIQLRAAALEIERDFKELLRLKSELDLERSRLRSYQHKLNTARAELQQSPVTTDQ